MVGQQVTGGWKLPRRRLLQFGTLQVGGLWLPSLLQRQAAAGVTPPRRKPAKACILLFMDGGPSQIDMWDMKPDAPSEIRGPFRPISTTVPGIQICEHLPLMARQMHRVTLIRSMRHDEVVHPPAVTWALTGFRPPPSARGEGRRRRQGYPHIGAAFGKADPAVSHAPKVYTVPELTMVGNSPPAGQDAGYLGAAADPLLVEVTGDLKVKKPEFCAQTSALPAERLSRRLGLLEQVAQARAELEEYRELSSLQQRALAMLADRSMSAAFDLDQEPVRVRERYGMHRQGQSALLARRLVEAGARFVTVNWGPEKQYWGDKVYDRVAPNPWDGHRHHFPLTKETLGPRADQQFSALLEDLDQRGMLDETLVVWMGEFGRTPRIGQVVNNAGTDGTGRDHWPHAYSLLLAGGGLPRGAAYGRTDDIASQVLDDPVTPGDLTATILYALGVDPRQLVHDLEGRPHPLTEGEPVRALFGE